ncbi:efflux transporter outer membrane subunit [Pelagerythrobacter rhizovicinus]|uniref:Efflux transporter outer membrane subunit n=1 Tax=Pelagerythrobacter rhizovicinus TaxID=2268576 RepID=A0A4Q2KMD1_9SPHN|nr:efflux transporter outer membrane subunit [Pelagerythrobacter rhizovicinus]RXZ64321.1 efflux transporter outer membrane subunit [Pelagerythrobacter rhizovicinus]
MLVTARILPLAALLLAGCTVGPDYAPPQTAVAPEWVEGGIPGEVDLEWWRGFGDPQLTALIERAFAEGPDLAEATARLAEARANRDAAAGGRLPAVSATGSATENILSEEGQLPVGQIPGFERDFPLFDLGFDASWEIDLWGRRTREVEAAEARADAARAGRREVMLTLAAEVARNYLDLRAAQADTATLEALAETDAEAERLTRLRVAAGEDPHDALDRAAAAAQASDAAVAAAQAQATAAAYRIAVLVGSHPEDMAPLLSRPAPLPAGPQVIAAGIRSDLLTRRPDVRTAERRLAAATADIGVATADLFPRFSLLGSIGQQARSVDDLFTDGATRLQVGPSLSWPIFAGGTIRARIRAADARAKAAAAVYEKAVLTALADSETALNRFATAQAAADAQAAALERQESALALARLRAASGETDRLALAQSRRAMLNHARAATDARRERAQAAVALFKALGGGWRDPPET